MMMRVKTMKIKPVESESIGLSVIVLIKKACKMSEILSEMSENEEQFRKKR